jgi:exopolysaccharide biosynthesis polyprenyl glycosylphosphotransferase
MKSNSSIFYALLLIVGDFFALISAFVIAYILRVKIDTRPLINQVSAIDYLEIWLLLVPIWIFIFTLLGLYRRSVYEYRWRELGGLLAGSVLGIMAVITYDFIAQTNIFPARLIPVYALGIGFLLLVLVRTLLRVGRMLLWRYGVGVNNLLVIGKGSLFESFIKSVNQPSKTGYKVTAIATDSPIRHFKGSYYAEYKSAFDKLVEDTIHTIVYIGANTSTEVANSALAISQAKHIAFKFIPMHDGVLSNKIDVDLFQGVPVVSVHQTALTGWGRAAKRIFDILFSSLALILLLPFLLIIAVFIWVSDGGSPIFRHKRLSRFDSEIYIYKFRSMKKQFSGLEPEEAFEKMGKSKLSETYRKNGDFLENDPRITKIGSFLRKTSLDELPQLLNVLKGDISLVGPRALAPAELKNYPYKNLILSVKSGLTGLAQISGRREIGFEERRSLDLYYVQNWTFWFDIKIIFRTIIMVLTGRGAR